MSKAHLHSRFLLLAALAAPLLIAQPPSAKQVQELSARVGAHKGDFDYLLGDWEFTGENTAAKFNGRWSATKMPNGQILDEFRVYGDKGQTTYVTSTVRTYNAWVDRWELIGMGGGGGLQDFGTGQRTGDEVHIEQRFGVAGGHPSTYRITYSNIKADSFSWSADRSMDGGQTWQKGYETLEARRIGPPRKMDSLTPATKPQP